MEATLLGNFHFVLLVMYQRLERVLTFCRSIRSIRSCWPATLDMFQETLHETLELIHAVCCLSSLDFLRSGLVDPDVRVRNPFAIPVSPGKAHIGWVTSRLQCLGCCQETFTDVLARHAAQSSEPDMNVSAMIPILESISEGAFDGIHCDLRNPCGFFI